MNTTIKKYLKQVAYLVLPITCYLIPSSTLTSCSDSHLADINTDDSKAETINPNSLLTTALLQTYGDFGFMDTYRSYITGFTQQLAGGWNVSAYAGALFQKDDQSSLVWDKFYTVGLKNLTDGILKSGDKKNVEAVMRIHRVYMMSVLTDIYGDVPCAEACSDNSMPKYDSQEDIYNWFFTELEDCIQMLGTSSDAITGDVTAYNGNVSKWKRYANSLRMRFAMRISDVNPSKAMSEFIKAYNDEAGFISDSSQDAYVKYLNVPYTLYKGAQNLDFRANALGEVLYGQDMTQPSFVCATLFELLQSTNDPRLWRICRYMYNNDRSEIRPDDQNIDITEDMKNYFAVTGMNMSDFVPEIGTAWYDNKKEDWSEPDLTLLPTLNQWYQTKLAKDPNFKITANNCHIRIKIPFYNIDFERPQTPGILMTSAEQEFLIAEAASKAWINEDVAKHFENGVRMAMQFLNDKYFSEEDAYASKITDEEISDYLQHINADLSTEQSARIAINTQAYILHLTNPSECWANLRRADYPVLKDRNNLPKWASFPTSSADNWTTPTRLCYPQLEADYNTVNYNAALTKLGGDFADGQNADDWHKQVWWDKYAQNFK